MRFIKRKNLMRGEELIYAPQLHWFYTIRHLVLSLPFFLILFILWLAAGTFAGSPPTIAGCILAATYHILIKKLFALGLLVVLVIFLCRVSRYLSTEYGVTNKRLILKKGVIRMTVAEIPTDRIESIYCVQGLLGRMFRYATVYVSGIGGTMPVFYMVARPYALRRKIVDIIEKNKLITVVHSEVPQGSAPKEPVPPVPAIYRYGTFVRVLPDGDN